jgi:serine/threonine protein kinase/formylglycine-generating enzyme required for sulfatase activity
MHEPHARAESLPPELEDRAYEILLDRPPPQRDGEFAALLAAQPRHAAELRALREKLRGAETALTGSGLVDAPAPTQVGPYSILRAIGEGGFGVVYLAEQSEPIQRQVAVKLIRPGMDQEMVLRRFESERELLARFDHPGVARILDAGRLPDGRPFLVTEFVDGEPLTIWCERRRLPIEERLRLFLAVCDGVRHAHQRGVIHRDLKPSNVLVTTIDGESTPKIIDFGIARALTEADTTGTRAGNLLGTPEYMSPEQAQDPSDVDTRADVYALGVMLYELLVGDLPQPRTEWRGAGLGRVLELIVNADAPRPSTRTTDRALASRLRGELDWIVLAAIQKDRERRYGSVRELAEEIERVLDDRPVLARPPAMSYLVAKFVRRHRVAVIAIGSLLAMLTVTLAFTAALYRESDRRGALARAHLGDFQSLAAVLRLDELRRDARTLWPPLTERVAACDEWIGRAESLMAETPRVRASLEAARLKVARAAVTEDAAADRFLVASLEDHLRAVDAFRGADGEVEDVRRRRAWASEVHARSVEAHADAWRRTIDAIESSPRYDGMRIVPQLGLVPIGIDPATGFAEFVHLQSGTAPSRDVDGRLQLAPEHGIVLVLLPGGRFWMGAQNRDTGRPNYEKLLTPGLGTIESIVLAPFFLAKHEVTRAQWLRVLGADPSHLAPSDSPNAAIGPLHPVENLSWAMADDAARRLDLVLPTEAQWEYACRAGSSTMWHTGADETSLVGFENLAGRETAANLAQGLAVAAEFRDDFRWTSPVGALRPNAFGLFDMGGNVAEWCADRSLPMTVPTRDVDGLRDAPESLDRMRVLRGASYRDPPMRAKSALRSALGMDVRNPFAGVRFARRVEP